MSSEPESTASENEEPKTTRITFHNPDTKHLPTVYEGDEDVAREHFEAVQYLKQRLGPGRTQLFGEFAVAVRDLDTRGDVDALLALCNELVNKKLELQIRPDE